MNRKQDGSTVDLDPEVPTSHRMRSESELDRKMNTVPLVRKQEHRSADVGSEFLELPMVRERDSGLPFYEGFRKKVGFSTMDEIFRETHTDMRSLDECDILISIALLITDMDYVEAVNLIACAGAVISRDIVSTNENRITVLGSIQTRMSDTFASYDRMMGECHHPLIETVDDIIEFGLRDDISEILDYYLEKVDEDDLEDEDYE